MLYTIGSKGHSIGNPANLQKIIFLVCRSIPDIIGDVFHFKPHEKGPYCKDIDEIILDLSEGGVLNPDDLSLTHIGEKVLDLIDTDIKGPLREMIDFWREFEYGLTEDELLAYVYFTNSDTVIDPEVIDGLRKHREDNTISLVKKDKITVEKGSEILGIGYFDFEDLLKEKNTRFFAESDTSATETG